MTLPNGEHAFVDLRMLRDYCLNTDHPRGRHKARVFAATLGFTAADAPALQDLLLDAARRFDAVPTGQDIYGHRFVIDFAVSGLTAEVTIRSTWIMRQGEDFPRLTSCFVL